MVRSSQVHAHVHLRVRCSVWLCVVAVCLRVCVPVSGLCVRVWGLVGSCTHTVRAVCTRAFCGGRRCEGHPICVGLPPLQVLGTFRGVRLLQASGCWVFSLEGESTRGREAGCSRMGHCWGVGGRWGG